MARPQKQGLDYFPLDSSFFIDSKIESLISIHGASAPTVYLFLMSKGFFENGYFLEVQRTTVSVTAKNLMMSRDAVQAIINECLQLDLFDEYLFSEYKILTSAAMQKIYQEAVKARSKRRRILVNCDYWMIPAVETAEWISIEAEQNEHEARKGKPRSTGTEQNINYDKVQEYLTMDFEKYE